MSKEEFLNLQLGDKVYGANKGYGTVVAFKSIGWDGYAIRWNGGQGIGCFSATLSALLKAWPYWSATPMSYWRLEKNGQETI